MQMELFCEDSEVDRAVEIFRRKGRTGHPDAGWVYVGNVEQAFRIDDDASWRKRCCHHSNIGSIARLGSINKYWRTDLWPRAEEHTSELQSIMRKSYAVLRLTKKKKKT